MRLEELWKGIAYRILVLLSLFLCMAAFPADIQAAGGKGRFEISTVEGKKGDTVSVKVSVSNNPGITALQLKISYPLWVMRCPTL